MTITIADGRGALWQWDTGRRVKITDGVGVKQIHYQNRCFGRSVDVDVGADGTAIIPDELLQDWHPLMAYAYVTDDAGGYTKVQVDFAVHKRARPADYVYTPTEQKTLLDIQRQIGDLADLTTEAKENLVAAINEVARMSGSESVGLRVADGYIQYSTDSGSTWKNLITVEDLKGAKGDTGATGQQGPAGAPGKDGAGMDITGATVGQIVKIAAVDASGVPTAWSPADMPSGGGGETWEAIKAITLADAVNTVTINTDSSGSAIALKKVRILVEGSAPHQQDIFFNNARYIRAQFVGTAASVGALSAEPFLGKMYCFAVTNNAANYTAVNHLANIFSKEIIIAEIKLIVNDAGTFSAGTKFTIQGVRV